MYSQANSFAAGAGSIFRRFIPTGMMILAAALSVTTSSKAGVTASLYLDYNGNAGSPYYLMFVNLATNALTPMPTNTLFYVWSPSGSTNSGVHAEMDSTGYGADGNGGQSYGSFASLISDVTNQWTLMTVESSATNFYYFNFSGFSSNDLPEVTIDYPQNNAAGLPDSPEFSWSEGPTNYTQLFVQVISTDYQTVYNSYLPLAQTNWQAPGTLTEQTNYAFLVVYNDFSTGVVASQPLDASSNAFSGWSSAVEFSTYDTSFFTLSSSASADTGHTLIAHYTFDNSGYLGQDSSGNGNNIDCWSSWGPDIHEFVTNAAVGAGAVAFFGDTSLTPCGQSFLDWSNALVGSFSISLWLNTTNLVGNDGDGLGDYNGQSVIFFDNNGEGTIPIGLTGQKVAFYTGDQDGHDDTLHSAASVATGNYVHVVVTRDQTTGEKRIYINGGLDSSDFGSTEYFTGDGYASIGGVVFSAYVGLVDDVQLYSGVLAPADVAALYASPGTTAPNVAPPQQNTNLVAHYTFDDSSNLGQDSSGNGYDLNFNGGDQVASSTQSAAGAGAAYFDGNSFFSYSPMPAAILNTLASNFSLSFWLNSTENNGNEYGEAYAGAGIVAADVPTATNDLVPAALDGGQIGFNTGPNDDTLNTTNDVNDGNYHHIVITRDQVSGEKRIYVDGALNNDDFATTNLLNTPQLVAVGCQIDASQTDPNNANPNNYLQGLLDDIQVYSKVISPTDVAFLYRHPGQVLTNTAPDFNAALNTVGLTYLTSGDAPWTVESTVSLDGLAAQSAMITNNQTSTLRTTITGPGTVDFSWETTNTAAGGYLFGVQFFLDGEEQDGITGDQPWYQSGPYFLYDSSPHTFAWTASANGSTDPGGVAYLDQIVITNTYPAYVQDVLLNGGSIGLGYHPLSLMVGTNATILNEVIGNPAPTYLWYKNGALLASQTNASLSFTNLQFSDAGYYSFITQNGVGPATEEDFQINPYLPANLQIVSFSYPTNVSSDSLVLFQWTVTNTGPYGVSNVQDEVDFSTPAGAPYFLQTQVAINNLNQYVPAGGTYTVSNYFRFANVGAGVYTLVLHIDSNGGVIETETNDNVLAGPPLTVVNPDIQPGALTLSQNSAVVGTTISVSYNTTNNGPGIIDLGLPPYGGWYDLIYLSRDPLADSGVVASQQIYQRTNIAVGGDFTTTRNFSIPAVAPGNYYIIASLDVYGFSGIGNLWEANESNNVVSVPIQVVSPDLTITNIDAPAVATSQQPIALQYAEQNAGNYIATNLYYGVYYSFEWYDGVYVSPTNILNGSAIECGLSANEEALEPGQTVTNAVMVTMPPVPQGNYYLLVDADLYGVITEADHANNVLATPLQVLNPDLAPVSFNFVPVDTARSTLQASWSVTNLGAGIANPAQTPWIDVVYVSTNPLFSPSSASVLGFFQQTNFVPGSGSYAVTNSITLPNLPSGSYYLTVAVASDSGLYEITRTNNTLTVPFTVANPPQPFLEVQSVTGPPQDLSGQPMEVSWVVANSGGADFNGTFHDTVSLSPNASGSNAVAYGTFTFTGSIPSGQSVGLAGFITPDLNLSGNQWISVLNDANLNLLGGVGATNFVSLSTNPVNVILAPLPQLQMSYVHVPPTAYAGQQITVTWAVTNAGGAGTGSHHWQDRIYLSADGLIDIDATYVAEVASPSALNPGDTYVNSYTFTLPISIEGSYYLVVQTDAAEDVTERSRANDTLAGGPVQIQTPPLPEFETTVVAPAAAFSGQSVGLSWQVANAGNGGAPPGMWLDVVYLSTNNFYDASAVLLSEVYHFGPLASGASYSVTNAQVALPVGISGQYYFIVVADASQSVYQLSRQYDTAASSPATTVLLTPPPDLVVTQISAPAAILSAHIFAVTNVVANAGASATPNYSWQDNYYLSATTNLNSGSPILLGGVGHGGSLQAGQTYTNVEYFTAPDGLTGRYYLIVDVDADNQVFELDKTNNVGFDPNVIEATAPVPVLVTTSLSAPSTVPPGNGINLSYTVQNQGAIDTAVGVWNDSILLSSAPSGANPINLGSIPHYGLLNPGDSYTVTNRFVGIPYGLALGTYYLFVQMDSDQAVYLGTGASPLSAPFTISLFTPTADLSVGGVEAPSSATAGGSIAVTWAVTNLGPGQTYADYWFDSVYLSASSAAVLATNRLPLPGDVLLAEVEHVNNLLPGAAYTNSAGMGVPADLSGSYILYVLADSGDRVVEDTIRSNNVAFAAAPLSVQPAPPLLLPDLAVLQVSAPANAFSGQPISLSYVVMNQGTGAASGTWYDAFYLSADPFLDENTAISLGSAPVSGYVTNGQMFTNTLALRLPAGLSDEYYLFVVAGAGGINQHVAGENNVNAAPDAIAITEPAPADLVVTSVQTPTNTYVDGYVTISYTIVNEGSNPAQGDWTDAVYLSTNCVWNASDTLLGYLPESGNIGAGSSYTAEMTFQLPGVTAGNYYLIVRPDVQDNLNEPLTAGNAGATTNTFAIEVPQLALGQAVTNAMTQGQDVYYKVYVPAGQTLSLNVNSGDSLLSANDLYVRFGAMPTAYVYDFIGNSPNSSSQQITVPATQAGWYYILAAATSVAGGQEQVGLEASLLQFSVTAITPSYGGNGGNVTVHIQGGQFRAQTVPELIGPGGAVITGSNHGFQDSVDMYATFDLQGAATGGYDLHLVQPGSADAVLPGAFTVEQATGSKLAVSVKLPGRVRQGFTYQADVNYENTGDLDLAAPFLFVTNSQNAVMSLSPDSGFVSGQVYFLGVAQSGPAGVLPPGATYTIPVYFQVPAAAQAHSLIEFEADRLSPTFTPVDWSVFIPPLGTNLPADAFVAFSNNIVAQSGPYVTNFLQALADDATFYSRQGRLIYQYSRLFDLEMFKAMNITTPFHVSAEALDDGLPSHGIPLIFTRLMPTALDLRFRSGPFGRGWAHSYQYSLSQTLSNLIDIAPPVGLHRLFTLQSDSTWQAMPGDGGTLAAAAGGGYALTEANGQAETYDSSGRLASIADPNGNQITFTYAGNNLTGITHSDGSQFTLAYDGNNHVTSLTDSAGRQVQYQYDATGNLLSSVVNVAGQTNLYTYVPATGSGADYSLTSDVLPNGTANVITYDALGRVTQLAVDNGSQVSQVGYDSIGDVFFTNALNEVTIWAIDERGATLSQSGPQGQYTGTAENEFSEPLQISLPGGQTLHASYDSLGRNVSGSDALGQTVAVAYTNLSRIGASTDQRGYVTRYGYDAQGNFTSTVYADGSSEAASHDQFGSVTNYVNRRGQAISYAYDYRGLMVRKTLPEGRVISYNYDAAGRMTNLVDSVLGITSMGYDSNGRAAAITYPDGRGLGYGYDPFGRRALLTNWDGSVIHYQFDSSGRLSGLSEGASNQLVSYTYNADGKLQAEDRANGTRTVYTYDAMNNVAAVTNLAPDNTVISFFNYTYDADNRIAAMNTAAGEVGYGYDADGQLLSATYPSAPAAVYAYDAAGNRLSLSVGGTNIAYSANAVDEYTQAGGATLLYDADGNLTNCTDAAGTTVYQYDSEDHLTSVMTPDGETVQYTYDGLGQRVAETSSAGSRQFLSDPVSSQLVAAYDGSGALIAHYHHGLGLLAAVDAGGNASFYDYDALGNSREVTGSSGQVLNRYDYDAYGAATLASETVSNQFRFAGRFGVMCEPGQLLFMKNRHYSTGLGRFVAADPIRAHGGINWYRYANNNPINQIDPLGLESPMIGLYSSQNKVWDPWAAKQADNTSIKTVDVNVGAAAGGGLTGDIIISDDGVHLAGGAIVWGEGVGGSVTASTSGTSEGNYIQVSIAAPGATVSVSFPDDGQSPQEAVQKALYLANNSSVNAGVYLGSPGVTVSKYYVSPNFTSAVGYAASFYMDHLMNILPTAHALRDFPDNPLYYLQHPSNFYQDEDDENDQVVVPGDPNDKTGPLGFGPNALISSAAAIPYTITFENASSNTAPAHTIVITDQLDPRVDPRSVRLTEIVFGTNTVAVPANRSFIQTNLAVATADGPVQANIIAGVNIQTGNVFWTLTAIDPATGLSPADPLMGLLPPDDSNHSGEGRVSYLVTPLAGEPSGTVVTNGATITFDSNPPMTTALVTNTLDAGTPESELSLSTNIDYGTNFLVSWSGADVGGESGLAGYNVYVSEDGGPFQLWLGNTTLTSAPYSGQAGHTYTFYSVAFDNAGNVQATPAQLTNSIYLSTNRPPVVAALTNILMSPDASIELAVQATDPNGGQLAYSLAGAPAGASINATNGLFFFQATRSLAGTTNVVTVAVTDNSVPPLTTTATFDITILDYLELTLGSTNLQAGQSAAIPVYLSSSAGVTNLVFAVQAPQQVLTNWTISPTAAAIASATVQNQATNLLVSLSTLPGQALQGTQQVSWLSFRALTNQPSQFIPLPVSQLSGNEPGGLPYEYAVSHPGQVVLVQGAPLLQAAAPSNSLQSLWLYGQYGTNYQLQFTTNLALPDSWQPLLDYTQTNGVIGIQLPNQSPVIFYRLLQR